MESLREQIDALRSLLSEADRRPYKYAKSTGPGPRHGKKKHKRDYWKCSCSNYKCACTGQGGERKKVNLDKEYRSEYNAQYKAWYSARKKVSQPSKLRSKIKKKRAAAKKGK